jgi:signal transduction histidine kinase
MIGQDNKRVEFISATTHELKTSLTAIIASAGLLSDELQLDTKSVPGRLIRSIVRNAHSIDERLSRFSEMAQLLAGDLRLQLEPVEIGQVIHDVATRFYPRIRSRSQSLTVELPNSLPLVKADRQYLEEILLSLVANASKFTPERGTIQVGAQQDDESLVVQVSDTGVGIPAEEQERIFQPYYQIKQDGGRRHAGSGLGLAITKSLVELHDGKIWLKSIVGQGSTFAFSLPIA